MVDRLSPEERSENMRRIRGKDTVPELAVRRLLCQLGVRYRLHYRKLPGKPDIVLVGQRKAIFVHGCFWHAHGRCRIARVPKSRIGYWRHKLKLNVERDKRNRTAVRRLGWRTMVIWECQTEQISRHIGRIRRFLDS